MKIILGLMLLGMISCVSSTEATASDQSDPQYWADMLLQSTQSNSTLTNDQLFGAFKSMIYNLSMMVDLIKKGDENEEVLTRTAQSYVGLYVDTLDYMMNGVISQENGYQSDCGDFSKTEVIQLMQYMIDSKLIDKVIALDPKNDDVWRMWSDKGTLLEWLGEYKEAGDCFTNASQELQMDCDRRIPQEKSKAYDLNSLCDASISMSNEARLCYGAELFPSYDGIRFETSHAHPLERREPK